MMIEFLTRLLSLFLFYSLFFSLTIEFTILTNDKNLRIARFKRFYYSIKNI